MSCIIEDAYYLITLHNGRLKQISTTKLNYLLFLTEAYYMCVNDAERLYKNEFNVDLFNIYVKEINEFFRERASNNA